MAWIKNKYDEKYLDGYEGEETKLIIPDDFEHISSQAFIKNSNIEEIVFSDNIIAVGERAFEGCKNLKKLLFCTWDLIIPLFID